LNLFLFQRELSKLHPSPCGLGTQHRPVAPRAKLWEVSAAALLCARTCVVVYRRICRRVRAVNHAGGTAQWPQSAVSAPKHRHHVGRLDHGRFCIAPPGYRSDQAQLVHEARASLRPWSSPGGPRRARARTSVADSIRILLRLMHETDEKDSTLCAASHPPLTLYRERDPGPTHLGIVAWPMMLSLWPAPLKEIRESPPCVPLA
jgi:hypothetical protein